MVKLFDFLLELLFKLETVRQVFRRTSEFSLPFGDSRISLLNPGKVFLPFADVSEKLRQIPLVGLGNVVARWSLRFSHC